VPEPIAPATIRIEEIPALLRDAARLANECERLKRQRDEANDAVNGMNESCNRMAEIARAAQRERDEAREQLAALLVEIRQAAEDGRYLGGAGARAGLTIIIGAIDRYKDSTGSGERRNSAPAASADGLVSGQGARESEPQAEPATLHADSSPESRRASPKWLEPLLPATKGELQMAVVAIGDALRRAAEQVDGPTRRGLALAAEWILKP
jgi:hypothetical protein